jgi:hypothetical protein
MGVQKHSPGCTCCPPAGIVCGPNTIPDRNLNCDWYYTNNSGGTSVAHGTLAHTTGTSNWTWLLGGVFADATTATNNALCGAGDGIDGGAPAAQRNTLTLSCTSSTIRLNHTWTCFSAGLQGYNLLLATASTFTQSPFRVTWTTGLHANDVMFDIFE